MASNNNMETEVGDKETTQNNNMETDTEVGDMGKTASI